MLFCFLISRNAKCLCHLWTAKRANLGFSLIATVTSLLRLRRGVGGWECMAGGGLAEGGMEGWRHSSPRTRLRCERTRQANRTQPGGVQQRGVGGQPALWKSPNTQPRGRRTQLRPTLLAQLWWGEDCIKLGNCWTFSWHWHLLSPHPPPDLAQRLPRTRPPFSAILLIDRFCLKWNMLTCMREIWLHDGPKIHLTAHQNRPTWLLKGFVYLMGYYSVIN